MLDPTFLERKTELNILSGLVDQLGSAGGKVVLIRGEAGIGKSSIVREFARSHRADANVHLGTCDDLFIPQPLGPFWDMARSEPSLVDSLREGDRARLLQAVLDLLSRPAGTIIIIEDTHWADEATLDAIRYIGRRIDQTNGVLVITYRDGELDYDHPLRDVIGDIPAQGMVRIQLGGLSLAGVSELLSGSDLDPADVFDATRGNPFLVQEMLSAADEGVPASLHDSVMARVRRLSKGSQAMLRTLSVIPGPIPRSDATRITGVDDDSLDECVQRGLLELTSGTVAFRHELIRQTIESALTASDRVTRNLAVLDALPEERYPSLLIHCAVEAGAIDKLLDLVPRSARYAAATGSHIQSARDYRELGPYLDRLDPTELGPYLDEWAREEYLVDDIPEAIRLNRQARAHYRDIGDRSSESRTLAWAAHWHELAGQHRLAEALANEAVTVLGPARAGADLARALEVNAYLHAMAGDVRVALGFVEQTLEAGGPDAEEGIVIRSLNHKGFAINTSDYPGGRPFLDEARDRATASGNWYEEARALINHGWAAGEHHDLAVASDYSQRAIATAVRHELPFSESYAKAEYSRILELRGEWGDAADLARELLDAATITQMVALPVIGQIEARRGRPTARSTLARAWELASTADEFHRLAPAAIAMTELAWISGEATVTVRQLRAVMNDGLARGFRWSTGKIAFWLWKLGELSDPPSGIAEPYRALMEGDASGAAARFEAQGVPYERALALMHGGTPAKLEALASFEELGADAVAAKARKELRDRGVAVPRGKSREARRNSAGLTARQAEVLTLLAEALTNAEIADRLFISPRTAEHHVSAVLDKLDVVSREEAVARARSERLVPSDT